jgi:hypothetical protein
VTGTSPHIEKEVAPQQRRQPDIVRVPLDRQPRASTEMGEAPDPKTRGQLLTCARGDLNRARPTLVMPDSASLSVK